MPEDRWFQATAGAVADEGSYYLNFNCYDPKVGGEKPFGVGAHTDWSYLTVLDVVDEGLEAEINGEWRSLPLEEGYLTINFGEPLQKLLPGVKACNHRVITQTKKMRTSTVMFVDPRVGLYRASAAKYGVGKDEVGVVWDWDRDTRKLMSGIPTLKYFEELSNSLYGKVS